MDWLASVTNVCFPRLEHEKAPPIGGAFSSFYSRSISRLDTVRVSWVSKVGCGLVCTIVAIVADAVGVDVVDSASAAAKLEGDDQLQTNGGLLQCGSADRCVGNTPAAFIVLYHGVVVTSFQIVQIGRQSDFIIGCSIYSREEEGGGGVS